jgi:hypothetical protein
MSTRAAPTRRLAARAVAHKEHKVIASKLRGETEFLSIICRASLNASNRLSRVARDLELLPLWIKFPPGPLDKVVGVSSVSLPLPTRSIRANSREIKEICPE